MNLLLSRKTCYATTFSLGVILFHALSLLINSSSYAWLFHSSIEQLEPYYPRFYHAIFIIAQIAFLFPYLALIFQWHSLNAFSLTISSKIILICGLALCGYFFENHYWLLSINLFSILLFYYSSKREKTTSILQNIEDKWIVSITVFVAFVIRTIWIIYTDNSGNGDAPARLTVAYRWIESFSILPLSSKSFWLHFFNPSLDWLPLHFYLTAITGFISNDWLYAPRILTAIFASLSIIPLYKISLLRFNKNVAIIAIILLCFYGYHIFLSSLVMSECFYLFFLLWSYYFIEKLFETNESRYLYWLAAMLCCCCLLRYEGWVFSGIVILALPFIQRMNWKTHTLFCSIVAISACFIMLCEVLQGEQPLRGILYSDFEIQRGEQYTTSITEAIRNLLPAFLPLSFTATITYILFALRNKKKAEVLLLFLYLIPISAFLLKTINGTLTTQARYLMLYLVILIPFIANYLNTLRSYYGRKPIIAGVILYLIVSNWTFANQVKKNHLLLKYPNGFMQSAQFAKQIPKGRFYIDYMEQSGNCNWRVYAQLKQYPIEKPIIDRKVTLNSLSQTAPKSCMKINGYEYDFKIWSIKSFDDLLAQHEISHIMLFPNGLLSNALHFTKPIEIYNGTKFERLFSQNGYMIYEIKSN